MEPYHATRRLKHSFGKRRAEQTLAENHGFTARVVGAPGGLPALAVSRSTFALRATADSLHGHGSEGWAHFEFTRISIEPIILRKKIEDVREPGVCGGSRNWRSRAIAALSSHANFWPSASS